MINLLARVVGKLVAVLLHEQFLPPVAFPYSPGLSGDVPTQVCHSVNSCSLVSLKKPLVPRARITQK